MGFHRTELPTGESHLTAKNRVWGFFGGTPESCPGKPAAAQQPRRTDRPNATKTASGVRYYGYRYYDPVTGRWPSRDPIGESGGINLYGMVGNDVVSSVDYLGLDNSGPFTGRTLNRFHSLPPEEKKKKIAEMRERECCDGVPFDASLYCCIDDKLYDFSEQGTGVFRALANAWDHPGTHDGLVYENGRTTIGINADYLLVDLHPMWWPNDGLFPKDDNGKPKFTAEIKLSKCDYDHEKFRQCMFGTMKELEFEVAPIYTFMPCFGNCRHHTDSIIQACKKLAKRR